MSILKQNGSPKKEKSWNIVGENVEYLNCRNIDYRLQREEG